MLSPTLLQVQSDTSQNGLQKFIKKLEDCDATQVIETYRSLDEHTRMQIPAEANDKAYASASEDPEEARKILLQAANERLGASMVTDAHECDILI